MAASTNDMTGKNNRKFFKAKRKSDNSDTAASTVTTAASASTSHSTTATASMPPAPNNTALVPVPPQVSFRAAICKGDYASVLTHLNNGANPLYVASDLSADLLKDPSIRETCGPDAPLRLSISVMSDCCAHRTSFTEEDYQGLRRRVDVINLLLERNANPNFENDLLYHLSFYPNEYEAIKILLDHLNSNPKAAPKHNNLLQLLESDMYYVLIDSKHKNSLMLQSIVAMWNQKDEATGKPNPIVRALIEEVLRNMILCGANFRHPSQCLTMFVLMPNVINSQDRTELLQFIRKAELSRFESAASTSHYLDTITDAMEISASINDSIRTTLLSYSDHSSIKSICFLRLGRQSKEKAEAVKRETHLITDLEKPFVKPMGAKTDPLGRQNDEVLCLLKKAMDEKAATANASNNNNVANANNNPADDSGCKIA